MPIEAVLSFIGDSPTPLKTGALVIVIYALIQLSNLLIQLAKNKIKHISHDKQHQKRIDATVYAHEIITTLNSELRCDRVIVNEFSNSNVSLALIPWNNMTCTYESCKLGKESMSFIYRNVPTTLIGNLLARLDKEPFVIVHVDEPDPSIPTPVYDNIRKRQATQAVYVPIRSPLDHKIIGLCIIDYSQQFELAESDLRQINHAVGQLSSVLSFAKVMKEL